MPKHASRTGTIIHGWPAAAIGGLLAAVGLRLVAQAMEIVGTSRVTRGTESWSVIIVGGAFALLGSWLAAHGLRGVRRLARARKLRPVHPDEPWRWDHVWDERKARDEGGARVWHLFIVGTFLVVSFAPFYRFAFSGWKPGMGLVVVALLVHAVALKVLVKACRRFAPRLRYGRGAAWFAHFPFRRGGQLELYVERPRGLALQAVVGATLRCVQERYVTYRRHGEDTTAVECFEIYRDACQAEPFDDGVGGRALRVSFDIPADAPTTNLASRPCRYWEVELVTMTSVGYAARFLVPVY